MKRRGLQGWRVLVPVCALLAGCPTAPTAPVIVSGSNPPVPTVSVSPAPQAFGSPSFPQPRAVTTPSLAPPSTLPGATAGASAAPAASGSSKPGGLTAVVPPGTPSPLPSSALPTLGQLVETYMKGVQQDSISGAQENFGTLEGVAVDGSNNKFFTDTTNHQLFVVVEVPEPDGSVLKRLEVVSTGEALVQPAGLASVGNSGLVLIDTGSNQVLSGVQGSNAAIYFFTLMAGGGTAGYVDGVGADARFNAPFAVAVDANGNAYVTDTKNHCIRKITPAQVVTTLAGNGTAGSSDGEGKAASFNSPLGIGIDAAGTVYVADTGNNLIRKITSDGAVTTMAGSGTAGFANGVGKAAQFNAPLGIAVDGAGDVFVSETGSQELRKITPDGAVTTLAGGDALTAGWVDGPGVTARFSNPQMLAIDTKGNLFVTEAGNQDLREVLPFHVATTFAGLGYPLQAPPLLLTNDVSNNPALFPTNQTCCAGAASIGFADGTSATASFNQPWAVVADGANNVYVADAGNHAIRKIAPDGGVTTLAGNGTAGYADGNGRNAQFNSPRALVLDGAGNLFVADELNDCIRKVTPDGNVSTLVGVGGQAGSQDGDATTARFNRPDGLAIDPLGNLFVADSRNNTIRAVSPTLAVSTYAGDGTVGYKDDAKDLRSARFAAPGGLAFGPDGTLYVADYGNDVVRTVTPSGVGTLAGAAGVPGWTEGQGSAAKFNNPAGVAVDARGFVYVADYGNSLVRAIDGTGTTLTWAGLLVTGTGAPTLPQSGYGDGQAIGAAFGAPSGLCFDARGYLYVADSQNHRIRKIY